jgi:hypothetical protein
MILGEMCVLSLTYGYVAVCTFCAVRCPIISCFSLLFPNYSTPVSQYYFYVCFLVLYVCFLLCLFCVFVLFYVLFLLLYIAVSFLFLYKFTDHCHRVKTQLP